MERIRTFFAIVELRTKMVSLSGILLGTAYAVRQTGRFSWFRAILMLVASLAIDMGTTAWNTYFDYLRGTDHPRFNREADKVLIHGEVSPALAFWTAFWLYLLAVPLGIALAYTAGFWVIWAGALGMLVGFFYNAGPYPISRFPVGELIAGGFLGFVLFLISYGVQIGKTGAGGIGDWYSACIAAIPSGLSVASILAVNNTCDIEGDREAGRRTFPVVMGKQGGEGLAFGTALGASLLLPMLAAGGILSRYGIGVGILLAVHTIYRFRSMHLRGYSHETKSRNMKEILKVFGVWSLGYLGVLVM